MTIRQYLKQTFDLKKLIIAKEKKITKLNDDLGIKSMALSPDKVQTSARNDKMSALTAAKIDVYELLVVEITKLLRLQYDIELMINSLNDIHQMLILTERYINLKQWGDIAADNDRSWKTVHKIHAAALKELQLRYPEFDE